MAQALYGGSQLAIDIKAGPGFRQLQEAFVTAPKKAGRAQSRALRKLKTWLQRKALAAASAATGIPQKFLKPRVKGGAQWYTTLTKTGLKIWLGTDPMPVHRTGKVRWSRRSRGARVGKRLYPGTWSWGPGSQSGEAIMQRVSSSRLPIVIVTEEIHAPVFERLQSLIPEVGERFERLLVQELNYALNVEGT